MVGQVNSTFMSRDATLLQAVRRAARRLASSESYDTLLADVLEICVEAVGAEGGTIYLHDKESRRLQFRHVLPDSVAQTMRHQDIPDDFGVAGRVFQNRRSEVSVFPQGGDPDREKIEKKVGVRARNMITVPLSMEDEEPIGVVQLVNKCDGDFDDNDVAVLDIVSSVSTMAFINTLLLQDQTRSSQLLGMGKVAHDIKNMAFALEANLVFSDETTRQLRERVQASGQDEILLRCVSEIDEQFRDLHESIDRIKGYSILISDLSAGKALQPELKLGQAGPAIARAASYMEPEGRSHRIGLKYEIEEDAPPMLFDEMYLSRIVQNLVSNAIKASAEQVPDDWTPRDEDEMFGDVIVRYLVIAGTHVVEVEDRGAGMSEETMKRILKGTARSFWSKSGGTGWGTKIVLELAASQGATFSIQSEVGKGSIFRVTFPEATLEGVTA